MKAIRVSRFGGPEVLQSVEVPIPEPGPGQVRIAVRAAGVGRHRQPGRRHVGRHRPGMDAGYDIAGVIDAVDGLLIM